MNNKGFLGNIIGAFLAIGIAMMLYPMIKDSIEQATVQLAANNTDTASTQLLTTTANFLPWGFGVAIAFLVITTMYNVWRTFNGDDSEEVEEEIEEPKRTPRPHEPRNYKEYVKERMEVEQMMGLR